MGSRCTTMPADGVPGARRWRSMFVAAVAIAGLGRTAGGDQPPAVEFIRVHVPEGRSEEVPLDADRYVPMATADFDRAIATRKPAAGAAPTLRPRAVSARYEARLDGDGRLIGSLAFELDAPEDLIGSWIPLGDVAASAGSVQTARGVGDLVLFGLPDGTVAARTPGPGRYSCEFARAAPPPGTLVHRLPLVPALTATLSLRLPAGVRPVPFAPAIVRGMDVAEEGDGQFVWRIESGPSAAVRFRLAWRDEPPTLRSWSEVRVRGRRAEIVTLLEPDRDWMRGPLTLGLDAGFEPTAVRVAGAPNGTVSDLAWGFGPRRAIVIDVPESLVATRAKIMVVGVAAMASGRLQPLPLARPAAERWAGGGVTLDVVPEFAIDQTDLRDAVPVAPDVAARWPASARAQPSSAGDADLGARMHFEHQAADAVVSASVRPRPAEFDVVRMTTVEISPRIVLGRAACELRVLAGDAFEARAVIGEGWLIDTVEALDVANAGPGGTSIPVEWRRLGPAGGAELRVAFAEAATRSRSVRLRIAGHRAGIPLGATFTTADMDMVRFTGEAAAAVDFRAGDESVVEIDGEPVTVPTLDARLAALVEPGPTQGRIQRGERAASQAARLVQRRPPLEADVAVELVSRDGQLIESFACACRAPAGDLAAVVVHVSEPLGEAVTWARTDVPDGAILARRLERGDAARGEIGSLSGIAESWLVEFSPAAAGEVRFRGTRGVEFTTSRPVPLAWVEAATVPRGTLTVRGTGAAWPRLVNRRLRELPPTGEDSSEIVGEFAYADPRTALAGADAPPAELLPADPASARAWAWRETTTCWNHASGRVECESVFEIDNHGRESVSLAVPVGLSVEAVTVDGGSAPFDGALPAGGELKVPLPPRRGRVAIAVRGTATRVPRFGCWRIDPVTCAIDAPVLERRLRVMLPPDLALFGAPAADDAGWMERLFAATAAPISSPTTSGGFREARIATGDPRSTRGLFVVRRRVVTAAAVAAGLAAGLAVVAAAGLRPGAAALVVTGLAVAALWLPAPVATVARAAWWGGLAGGGLAWFGRPRRLVAACLAVAVLGGSVADAAQTVEQAGQRPFRVLVAPGGDVGTVLVPEPLFRLLSADEFAAAAAVRVVEVRAEPLGDKADSWRVIIDVDADRGGLLTIDQAASGARWRRPAPTAPPGLAVTIADEGAAVRLAAIAPGRYRVALEVDPAVEAGDGIESVSFCLPAAARGRVAVPPVARAGKSAAVGTVDGWQCDLASRGEPWMPAVATPTADGFDVSRATQVRLVRAVDPRRVLVSVPKQAASANEIDWRDDGCRVRATFEFGADDEIVRTLVVRADEGLVPGSARADAALPDLRSLGGSRFLVELARPAPGRSRVDVEFTMPLADPVGVFDVPGVWLEGVHTDSRTVRLAAPAGFEVDADLPAGGTLLRSRDEDGPAYVAAWRHDEVDAGDHVATAEPGRAGRARISVTRRPRSPRGIQTLGIGFTPDATTLSLACEIDAQGTPLTEVPLAIPAEAVVDRVTVSVAGESDPASIDSVTARPTPERLVVVPQRPRTGRLLVQVEARLPGPPPPRGRLPLMRAAMFGETPLEVGWRAGSTSRVVVDGAAADESTCEVAEGNDGPEYALVERAPGDERAKPAATAAAAGQQAAVPEAILNTEVWLASDGGGRAHGAVRFELTTSRTAVDVTLPAGWRLFDAHVDGREVDAEPARGNAWQVPLNATTWPHVVTLTMAGEIGGALAGGDPIRLTPPLLEGLECRDILWTIEAPADLALRVAEPARPIDEAELQVVRAAARERLVTAFEAGLFNAGADEAQRLQRIVDGLRGSDSPPADAAWIAPLAPFAQSRERIFVVAADGTVTIRGVKRPDATSPARGLATVAIAGVLAAGWSLTRRWPASVATAIGRSWPWLLVCAGTGWTALLAPALPGWVMVVLGGAAAIVRVAAAGRWRESSVVVQRDGTVGSTRTLLRG